MQKGLKNMPNSSAGDQNKMNSDEMLSLYEQMLLIRRFEERSAQLYGRGLIAGFCHLYIGQEAVVVGMQSVSKASDTVITAYRDHGHMLACGMDPKGVMAELTGRRDGYSKGKGGSMHMFSREKNFFGGHGIVGAQASLGTGIAFAHRYRQDNGVCLTYIGDGAMNQGQVYESLNMAALWKLPLLLIVENNQYAMGTSTARHSASHAFYNRGEIFGIPGELVDGMDIFAVREAGMKALEYIRSCKGPYILEMKTYRYRGHSMSDPATYRTKEEVEGYRDTKDPILNLKKHMMLKDLVKEDDFKAVEQRVKDIVLEAAKFAEESPEPEASELYTDILIEPAV
jgi:pyruvate dehydrogenase E1 component alpha subunit